LYYIYNSKKVALSFYLCGYYCCLFVRRSKKYSGLDVKNYGSVAKIILLPFWAIIVVFCIVIDPFRVYKYPICDVFHWFCKIARFFATEPKSSYKDYVSKTVARI